MGKLTTYLLIISGIMILMYYAGFLNGSDSLLTYLLNPSTMRDNGLALTIVAAVTAITTVVYLVAWAITGDRKSAALAPVAIYLLDLGYEILKVFNTLQSMNASYTPLLVIFFAPLLLIYTLTIIEWWNGVTT